MELFKNIVTYMPVRFKNEYIVHRTSSSCTATLDTRLAIQRQYRRSSGQWFLQAQCGGHALFSEEARHLIGSIGKERDRLRQVEVVG